MIGSGELFGTYHAAKIAGPYAIWSLIVLRLAQGSALSPEETVAMMQRM
ncbi:MAG TPA: hypothetical protein VMB34_28080 [Acetobacteraceae bacterium]|nr:hypothetical protein [Acetobacteraceae bacterium]